MRNISLSTLLVFFAVCIPGLMELSAQNPSELLGRWTGITYIVRKPDPTRPPPSGISARPIYDSCVNELYIKDIQNGKVSGEGYMYIVSDPAGSYCKTKVDGYLVNAVFRLKSVIVEKKLTKYPSYWWCDSDQELQVLTENSAYFLTGNATSPGCLNGEVKLTKERPVPPVNENTDMKTENPGPADSGTAAIYSSYQKRKSVLVKTIAVQSDTIYADFYDNGEIDNDTISVFVNDSMVAAHKKLLATPYTVMLVMDKAGTTLRVVMVAENLGSIPPNTALMKIRDGRNRYHVFIKSDFKNNAMVELKRKPR